MHADVVVVGSGAGGSSVAGELARSGAKVLLIEAGGEVAPGPSWQGRNKAPAERDIESYAQFIEGALGLYAGSEPPPRDIPGSVVAHALGGVMTAWTHNCPSPSPTLEPVTGVDQHDLNEALDRARALLSVSSEVTDGGVRQARLMDRALEMYPDASRPPQAMPLAARFTDDGSMYFTGAGDLLLYEGAVPENLEILSSHIALRLNHRDGHAESLEVVSRSTNESSRISADRFVLAAGAIGTPKLLVASALDAGPALGRYLTDHPHVCSSVLLADDLREGVPEDDRTVGVLFPVDEGHRLQSEIVKFPVPVTALPDEHDPLFRMDVFTTVGVEPDPENRLIFAPDQTDSFGLPRFDARLAFSETDEQSLREATAEHVRVLQGIANANDGWDVTTLKAGSSTHLMGTHRIGAQDDGESVADPTARLWRSDNVWLAGNGLINHWTACNPSLTTAALGLMAADAIVAASDRG